MSNTPNQWIPVSERLPEYGHFQCKLILFPGGQRVAFLAKDPSGYLCWQDPTKGCHFSGVTHWMDLPKPPDPPKPADPFEAWLDKQLFRDTHLDKACFYTPDHKVLGVNTAKWVWDAAKEHYSKPLPDFETWWNTLRPIPSAAELRDVLARHVEVRVAQHIWNVAQGKPEA